MSKIIALKSENVKRIQVAEIHPDGSLVILGGRNGAGKSSLIDSVMYALAGKDTFPSQPVRRGAEKAVVDINIDNELFIHRVIQSTGGTSLVIKNKEGLQFGTPQAILDRLIGKLTFDPLEFANQKPDKQAETLRILVGLDFTQQDAQRKLLYDNRTLEGRELKQLQGQLAGAPHFDGMPIDPVSMDSIDAEQKKAIEHNQANEKIRRQQSQLVHEAERAMDTVNAKDRNINDIETQIKRIQQELANWQQLLEYAKSDRTRLADALNSARQKCDDIKTKAEQLKDVDLNVFRQLTAEVVAKNAKIQKNKDHAELMARVAAKAKRVDELTTSIDQIDQAKTQAIATAKYPVDGLSFSPDGMVLYNGLPFDQASGEKLRVSVAIGLALNPKLRVLFIRNGSLMDEDNLKLIAEMAAKADAQVWLEKVGTGNVSVVIEDGMVKTEEAKPVQPNLV